LSSGNTGFEPQSRQNLLYKLYVPVTVRREQSVKKEHQQDAKI